jgi:ubiquinone/menaquinone biosynthesis C-methylase UbiE
MNLIFRILIYFYSFVSFFERKIFVKNIKKGDLVLDVGSGDKPFWRADVIVDKYLKDDQQRHSGSMVFDKRKVFIDADVESLPFKDKVFDFVFCSHLLEHVENPDKAISELTRVAKKGYIEVPYAISDLFQPFPPHLWYCGYDDGFLIFKQREKEGNFFNKSTERFGKKLYSNPLFQYLLAKDVGTVFIRLYWEKSIKFKVIRAAGDPYVYSVKSESKHKKTMSYYLSFIFYKFFYLIMTSLFYEKKTIEIDKITIKK